MHTRLLSQTPPPHGRLFTSPRTACLPVLARLLHIMQGLPDKSLDSSSRLARHARMQSQVQSAFHQFEGTHKARAGASASAPNRRAGMKRKLSTEEATLAASALGALQSYAPAAAPLRDPLS